MAETTHRTVDLQASRPEVELGLTRAGVTGVAKAIRIRHENREKTFAARISCAVDLDPAQKGVHMSRFPELFGEAIDEVVIGEAFLVETLAEHIARHIVERQDAYRPRCESRRSTRSSAGPRSATSRRRRSPR
jgi:GTP cyclohydrolase FolE2